MSEPTDPIDIARALLDAADLHNEPELAQAIADALRAQRTEGRPRPCAIGEFCGTHGFVHGAEAEELRERMGKLNNAKVNAILDDVDARDSCAYLERNRCECPDSDSVEAYEADGVWYCGRCDRLRAPIERTEGRPPECAGVAHKQSTGSVNPEVAGQTVHEVQGNEPEHRSRAAVTNTIQPPAPDYPAYKREKVLRCAAEKQVADLQSQIETLTASRLTDVQRANLLKAREFISAQGGRDWRHHVVAAIDAALAAGGRSDGRATLKKYGRHLYPCPMGGDWTGSTSVVPADAVCTCGLDAAIAALPSASGEADTPPEKGNRCSCGGIMFGDGNKHSPTCELRIGEARPAVLSREEGSK